MRRVRLLLVLGLLALGVVGCAGRPNFALSRDFAPATMFLTWQNDPTTTMTVQWLEEVTEGDAAAGPLTLHYSADGNRWRTAAGERKPFGSTDLQVCRIEITGLRPDTDYRFVIDRRSPEYHFRTAPATLREGDTLRFAAGGDAGPSNATRSVCEQAAKVDPLFALVGGDIAYANGKQVEKWVAFLTIWNETMRTADGRTIPMIVCIGNHEVQGGYNGNREKAPFFYSLFDGLFRETGYATLDFGDYMSFILLDTNHTTAVEGAQTEWLERALQERAGRPHLFAVQHVPSYPSHRAFDGQSSPATRQHWVPLFERYGVDVVFENHDHTYKRSPLIRNGAAADEGVLYLGDGAWGAGLRSVRAAGEHWYIAASRSVHHFILTEIGPHGRSHKAITGKGEVFDEYVAEPALQAR